VHATPWLAGIGFGFVALTAKAEWTAPQAAAPETLDKLTLAAYRVSGDTSYDVNLRRKFGEFVAWIGGYYDRNGPSQARAGA
jgi:hypothetical protein